ncbi:MAG TPA: ATP-binding protein [Vicinamibacteria bacterium]|nr:ATP-binding protein [Vicinamibacteria bacterium]
MIRRLLRTYLPALLLGLLGLGLNRFETQILTEETPEFVFGGAPVLLAFVWLGFRAGLLSGVVALGALLFQREPAGWATGVYLLEAAAAALLYRRFGSLVFSVVVFWLGAGWALDLLLYGGLVGLSRDYLVLLFAKQVFNGILSALLAEVGLEFLGAHLAAAPARPLRTHVFSRVVFVVMIPALVLGLFYTRATYQRCIAEARNREAQAAAETSAAVAGFLGERTAALRRLARRVEQDWSLGGRGKSPHLAVFALGHPEFLNLGLTDALGTVLDMNPAVNALGETLVRGAIGRRGYFQQARSTLSTAYAPLILGNLHVREARGSEPVLLVAEPLLDRQGGFAGALFAALDGNALQPLLSQGRQHGREISTLFDHQGTTIVSLDPARPPGAGLRSQLPAQVVGARSGRTFTHYPPPDDSLESRLALNLRHAAYAPVLAPGWGVLVELPAAALHAEMAPSALRTLASFLGTLGILYLVVSRFTRSVSDPLLSVSRAASEISLGRAPEPRAMENLALSPMAEIRDLATQFAAMEKAVAERSLEREEALRRSEALMRAFLESIPFDCWATDQDGRYVLQNSASVAHWGRRLGRTPAELDLPPPLLARWEENNARALGGEVVRGEVVLLQEGQERTYYNVIAPIWDGGRVRGTVGVNIDVSDRKRLEEQLRQAQKMEAVGRLAGGVAHDFNNILNVIAGYAVLLERGWPEGPERVKLSEIVKAADRATALVRQLLAFSRRQVLQPRVLDLNDVVLETDGMLRRLIGEHIELLTVTASDLGRVKADPGQMQQVLVNLAVNARDAMPSGGRLTIRTANLEAPEAESSRAGAVWRYVRLTVSDTGCGMDAETRARLFEPFFTTKAKGSGTGLGLATVYGIVAQSGGAISVETAPGQGASFRIDLPRTDEAVEPERPSEPAIRHGGSETLLLVEDEDSVRRLALEVLRSRGYTVLEAARPQAALEAATRHPGPIHLLVTDVVMPGMDGPTLAQRLLELRPGLKVLFMSGYSEEAVARGGVLEEGAGFLQKPAKPDELTRAVRRILDRQASA